MSHISCQVHEDVPTNHPWLIIEMNQGPSLQLEKKVCFSASESEKRKKNGLV